MRQFKQAIDYILVDSVQNAEQVRSQLLAKIDQAADIPYSHLKDKYKINNDGSYRAFEQYHYRVTYRIIENGIKIIRIRHTSMIPESH